MSSQPAPSDPYAEIVDLYDLEHDGFGDDIQFYLNSIESAGDPVLELGCGTGRILRPIANAGFRVTGVDSSPAMLEQARAASKSSQKQKRLITLHEGKMEEANVAPGGPFGIVLFSLNGLLHLSDPALQIQALRSAHAALDPRGQLLIDVFNPTLDVLQMLGHGVTHEGVWTREDGTQVDKFSARKLSTSNQTIQTRVWYDLTSPNGTLNRIATSFDLRYLHRHELELMLQLAGFKEWQIYGSYDLDPYDDASERLIFAAEPR